MSGDIVPTKRSCHCDGFGWIHTTIVGPDGHERTAARPCKACNPTALRRIDDEGLRRTDPAIHRHRAHRSRISGRGDDR